jgi:hypothetical protein
MMLRACLAAFVAVFLGSAPSANAQLKVGAAKVDITPAPDRLPGGLTGILDHIYTRAIYVTNGQEAVLLINVDVGKLATPYYALVAGKIVAATGVPEDHIILSAVHDHEAPPQVGDEFPEVAHEPNSILFRDNLQSSLVQVARAAKAAAQPAKMGYGTGLVYLNVNRDAIDPRTRLWKQEDSPEFPSDKTLAVLQFLKPSGEPIAIYMNYAMHAVSLFLHGNMSGDFPEAASQYVERVYGDKMVAVWSSGAAGDQNPMFQRPSHLVTESRITNEMSKSRQDDPSGEEMNNALHRLWTGTSNKPPLAPDALNEELSQNMVRSMGQIMGEEALDVMARTRHFETNVVIHAAVSPLECAGRDRIDHGREGYPGQYKDGAPVRFRVGEMRIGNVALGAIDAEVYSMIGQQLKRESPFTNTLFVTVANGQANSGYVPTDDALGRYTFEVLGTRLKPGCAERGIVETVDGMIENELLPTTQH